MTKTQIAFFLLMASAALGQPTVSNITTVSTSHSTVVMKFDASSVGPYTRVRYGLTTAYEGAGTFPDSGIQHYNMYDLNTTTKIQVRVTGLKPNTAYNFCPQVSTDNVNWSPCVNHTAATGPLPAGDHPAYPVPPAPVDTARPNTSGYTVRSVASNCSDLQSHIDAAALNLPVNGSLVLIPAGTVCTGTYYLKTPPVKSYAASGVNTLTNRITVPAHGLTNNDQVRIAAGSPIASAGVDIFRQHRGFPSGDVYYAIVIDANTIQLAATSGGPALPFTITAFTVDTSTDVFSVPSERYVPQNGTPLQVVSSGTLPAPLAANTTYYVTNRNGAARTLQLSATNGGAAINITNNGSGTHSLADQGGGGQLIKWPPTTNQIVIRTATPDSQFVPEGVRVTPEFATKMASIRPASQGAAALYADDLAHNYRFEGIEFTHVDTASAEIGSTINPMHWWGFMQFQRATANIILDRCYIHGLGFPNRVIRAFVEFNGANSAIINSYLEKLDYWTPVREGLTLTRAGNTQFTLSAGTFHIGPGSRSIASTVTVNTSGSASGAQTGKVYLTMAGVLTLDLPVGVSATCSGAACTVINSASPGFPMNGAGGTTVMPIGNLSFTAAALTSVEAEGLWPSNHQRSWEGASTFIAGDVGGRTALINNTISASGLPIHYDDANGNQGPTGTDYTIQRNLFTIPLTQIWNLPGSDKLRYGQRQQLEWKNGKRIRIRGNIFEHVFVDATPIAVSIAISGTPGPNSAITDVEIGYNIFRNGSGTFAVLGGRPKSPNADTHPPSAPLQRTWIHNNLAYGINQYKYRGYTTGNSAGAITDHRYAIEDLRFEHNTFHDLRGTTSNVMTLAAQGYEGLRFADNIFWINGGTVFGSDECLFNIPACSGDGKTLLDGFSQGYTWTNNTMIAGWTNETGVTPRTSKTHLTNAFPGGMIDAYLQSEMPGNVEWLGNAEDGNFRIAALASHKSGGAKRGSDGSDRGVDMDTLEREIGVIRLAEVLNITSTSAKIPFVAPDRGAACRVAYGTGEAVAWTGRSAVDTTDGFARLISIPGSGGDPLIPNTEYGYRVWCSGTAQSKTVAFRTPAQ